MQTAYINISGHWAHFKKPETNNNPLTHDFITKTAMIGMIGAVLGIERELMRPLFPILSEDLLYGVALNSSVWKQSWGFTLRRFDPDKARLEPTNTAPRAFEFLREPNFTVVLALKQERSNAHFHNFLNMVRDSQACYDPVLGLHNCPAEIRLESVGTVVRSSGQFRTRGFIPRDRKPLPDPGAPFRIGFERIPTFQNSEMWNPPDKYIEVVYTDVMRSGARSLLNADGEHFKFHAATGPEEAWCLT